MADFVRIGALGINLTQVLYWNDAGPEEDVPWQGGLFVYFNGAAVEAQPPYLRLTGVERLAFLRAMDRMAEEV